MMLEHSIYSVISPEGCASILWKDAEKGTASAKLTGDLKFGVVPLQDVFDDGETQTGPAANARLSQIDPVETLGDSREMLFWYAHTLIRNGKHHDWLWL